MTAPEKSDVKVHKASKDPDEDEVIACAVSIGADYLVTGDSDLRCREIHSNAKMSLCLYRLTEKYLLFHGSISQTVRSR